MSFRWLGLFASFVVVVSVAGCSQSLPPEPATYPVRGKVMLPDGQPVTVGTVHLKAKDPKKAISCEGDIKPDGAFSVRTFVGKEGAVPGTYLLSVEPYNAVRHGKIAGKAPAIPEKYTDPSTSEIVVEVKTQENDVGSIVLK